MSRLLTDEEITVARGRGHNEYCEAVKKDPDNQELLGQEFVGRAIAETQRDLTRKETLKAVGERLENKRAGRTMADGKMALVKEIPDENWVCFLTDEDVNALKRGEMMPEEK